MFWKKKNKGNTPQKGKDSAASAGKPTREQILAQAKANAASARAEIGDETLDKIKEALLKKQASAIEQAKRQIQAADQDKVRDNIKFMMNEDRPPKKK
jgi:hypothetical protein